MNKSLLHTDPVSLILYFLIAIAGLLLMLYPFLIAGMAQDHSLNQSTGINTPILISFLLGFCLLVMLYEVQGQAVNTKVIALLGVLVAINAALRFIENAIPGPGGFSPVFFLIILTGYAYGGRFGFLMGALTLFVSAIITGGVGPWLPGQMFTAGWVGMTAPICRPLVGILHRLNSPSNPQKSGVRPSSSTATAEIVLLSGFGILWGFLFGAMMNLWTYPFIAGAAEQLWVFGVSLREAIGRYMAYYIATSLVWDTMRAIGNGLLIFLFGMPTLRVLRRFQSRFTFVYQPSMPQDMRMDHQGG